MVEVVGGRDCPGCPWALQRNVGGMHAECGRDPGDAGGWHSRDGLCGRDGPQVELGRRSEVGGCPAVERRRGLGGRGGLRVAGWRQTRRPHPAVGAAILRQSL